MVSAALASLLGPYQAAIEGTPTTPSSLGMLGPGLSGGLYGVVDAMKGQVPALRATAGGADPDANRWEEMAARMAANKYGWGPDQFGLIDSIIERESGWNPNAVNPDSGAYGIPQILPQAHPDDVGLGPRGQVKWLLDYIKTRYGTPEEAVAFKDRVGWY